MKRLILVLMVILIGCSFTSQTIQEAIEASMPSIGTIITGYEFKFGNDNEWTAKSYDAICFSIGNGYWVALSHATIAQKKAYMPIEYRNINWTIGDEKVELIGRHEDISLFKGDADVKPIFGFKTNELYAGDEIWIIGYPFAMDNMVKRGVVGNLDAEKFGNGLKNSYVISAPIYPGDSGSPVLKKNKDGKYVFVGIVYAVLRAGGFTNVGFAFNSDYVLKTICEISGEAEYCKQI